MVNDLVIFDNRIHLQTTEEWLCKRPNDEFVYQKKLLPGASANDYEQATGIVAGALVGYADKGIIRLEQSFPFHISSHKNNIVIDKSKISTEIDRMKALDSRYELFGWYSIDYNWWDLTTLNDSLIDQEIKCFIKNKAPLVLRYRSFYKSTHLEARITTFKITSDHQFEQRRHQIVSGLTPHLHQTGLFQGKNGTLCINVPDIYDENKYYCAIKELTLQQLISKYKNLQIFLNDANKQLRDSAKNRTLLNCSPEECDVITKLEAAITNLSRHCSLLVFEKSFFEKLNVVILVLYLNLLRKDENALYQSMNDFVKLKD